MKKETKKYTLPRNSVYIDKNEYNLEKELMTTFALEKQGAYLIGFHNGNISFIVATREEYELAMERGENGN